MDLTKVLNNPSTSSLNVDKTESVGAVVGTEVGREVGIDEGTDVGRNVAQESKDLLLEILVY